MEMCYQSKPLHKVIWRDASNTSIERNEIIELLMYVNKEAYWDDQRYLPELNYYTLLDIGLLKLYPKQEARQDTNKCLITGSTPQ